MLVWVACVLCSFSDAWLGRVVLCGCFVGLLFWCECLMCLVIMLFLCLDIGVVPGLGMWFIFVVYAV